MIEPTDEMVRAFNDADFSGLGNADWEDSHVRAGLAAVLAIVERNYSVFAHCDQAHPTEDLAYCELPRHHTGKHTATVEKAVDW